VVVQIVDENCIFLLKAEDDSPIAIYSNGPEALEIALQSVKMPSWLIHVLSTPGEVQSLEKNPHLRGMIGLNSGFASGEEKLLNPRVSEASDHL
jgi:hypothetical protein